MFKKLAALMGIPLLTVGIVLSILSMVIQKPMLGRNPLFLTLGLWLINISLSFVGIGILWAWEKFKGWISVPWKTFFLSLAGGAILLVCSSYCIIWWDKSPPPTLWEPDMAIPCWAYCGTYVQTWGTITLTVSSLTIITAVTLRMRPTTLGAYTAIVLGLLTIPIGLLAVYSGYLTLESRIEKIDIDQNNQGPSSDLTRIFRMVRFPFLISNTLSLPTEIEKIGNESLTPAGVGSHLEKRS